MLSTELIEQVLNTIPQKRIGLIGDLFLDRYLDIDLSLNEPSLETGLTAFQVVSVRNYPGALGTVLNNLAALGVGFIEPVTLIGQDGEGYDLIQALRQLPSVSGAGIVQTPLMHTPTYTKPMLVEAGRATEFHRLDIKNRRPTPVELQAEIRDKIVSLWHSWDAVLILDQVSEANCGVVTDSIREEIERLVRASPKFALADSRENISQFHHVSIKPNQLEATKLNWHQRPHQRAFVTRGAEGLDLYEPGIQKCLRISAYPVAGPIDICGAGDSCSAGIASGIVSGLSPAQAAAFGNLVASITIQQLGVTGTASPAQVRERWRQVTASATA